MIKFQYYPARVKSNQPIGVVSLENFLMSTKNPKPNIVDIFNRIAQAESNGDLKLKSELKQNNLYYFTPCVFINNYRRYANILRFTGLLVLDFDHIDNAKDFKYYLFEEYRYIIAAWLSPSKRGVKALAKIPIVKSVGEFKAHYYSIAHEMYCYDGFDGSGQNSVLPLFQSWDADLLQREDYEIYTDKGIKESDFVNVQYSEPCKCDSPKTDWIIKIIDTGFSNINDNGHPQLRSLCLAIGGYVANGYIDENDAINRINYKIQTHIYLNKGVKGYQRTAREMLNYGKAKPLSL